jgi:hypothetical protein
MCGFNFGEVIPDVRLWIQQLGFVEEFGCFPVILD